MIRPTSNPGRSTNQAMFPRVARSFPGLRLHLIVRVIPSRIILMPSMNPKLFEWSLLRISQILASSVNKCISDGKRNPVRRLATLRVAAGMIRLSKPFSTGGGFDIAFPHFMIRFLALLCVPAGDKAVDCLGALRSFARDGLWIVVPREMTRSRCSMQAKHQSLREAGDRRCLCRSRRGR